MTTTNFPDGVTNASSAAANGTMIQTDPTLLHQYFNDFDTFTAGDWVITETDSSATEALTAGDGGLLLITNTAGATDLVSMQKTPAAFAFSATKRAWFAARLKVSDATQSAVQVGMVIVDTSPLDATDGIYFQKEDGSTNIAIYCRKNASTGSNSATAIGTMADDTYKIFNWYYDGAGTLYYGLDGVIVGNMSASSSYLPDATNITVSVTLQNGEAVAKTMTVDYVYAAFER